MLEITPPSLTKKDLKKKRLDHQSKKIRTRFNVLWLTTISSKASEIALIAGVSIRSVFDYIKMYNEGGLKVRNPSAKISKKTWNEIDETGLSPNGKK